MVAVVIVFGGIGIDSENVLELRRVFEAVEIYIFLLMVAGKCGVGGTGAVSWALRVTVH